MQDANLAEAFWTATVDQNCLLTQPDRLAYAWFAPGVCDDGLAVVALGFRAFERTSTKDGVLEHVNGRVDTATSGRRW